MASFTSKATGNYNSGGQTTWVEVGTPGAGDDITIKNGHLVSCTQAEACAGAIIEAGGELDIVTYTFTNGIKTDVYGILDIGSNGNLITAGWEQRSGSTFQATATAEVHNSGNLAIPSEALWSISYTCKYWQTGNGNAGNPHSNNKFARFEIQTGVTMTLANNTYTCHYGGAGIFNYGTIDVNGNILYIGCDNTGDIYFDATSDITGGGEIQVSMHPDGTLTDNTIGGMAFTGLVRLYVGSTTRGLPTGDWRNADYRIDVAASTVNVRWTAGTLKIKNLYIQCNTAGRTLNADASTNNPNFEIPEILDFKYGSASYTLNWAPGTGTAAFTDPGDASTYETNFNSCNFEDIIINCNLATRQLTTHVGNVDSITLTTGKLDAQTYDINSLGKTDVYGYLTIGASSNTGLTTNGLEFRTGSDFNAQITSIVSNSGDLIIANEKIWTSNYRCLYTQTASANAINPNNLNRFRKFTNNLGAVITQTGDLQTCYYSGEGFINNGTIVAGANVLYIGCSIYGEVTFGASSDITGTGELKWSMGVGGTYTNSMGTLSFAGRHVCFCLQTQRQIPMDDFSNAHFRISANNFQTPQLMSGTLKCRDFDVYSAAIFGFILTVDAATNNPNYEISGNIDLHAGGGNNSVVWDKGTGYMKLPNGNASIALDNKNVEEIRVDCLGGIKTCTEPYTSTRLRMVKGIFELLNGDTTNFTNFIGVGGTLRSASSGNQAIFNLTNPASVGVSNVSFQDLIRDASGEKINAKNSCTNLGGNNRSSIIFNDKFTYIIE